MVLAPYGAGCGSLAPGCECQVEVTSVPFAGMQLR